MKRTVMTMLMASLLASPAVIAGDLSLMLYQNQEQTILTWSNDNTHVLRQEVYRVNGMSGPQKLIATLTPDERTYEDADAVPYADYSYQVKAVTDSDKVIESNLSNTFADTSAPVLLKASAKSECYAGATIQNKTVDCGGKTIGLSCNGDDEHQKPVLTLINATVKNVRISKNGGSDGIHCKSGNCTLENVIWEDICEDAATNNGKKMTIIGGVAYNSKNGPGGKPDKVFQHNSKNSTVEIKGNFTLTGEHGKLYRSCGNCTDNGGPRYLTINGVKIDAKIGSVAGVNGNFNDRATIRNLKIKNYQSGKPHVCVVYKGVQHGHESPKVGEKWSNNSTSCNVSKSDVTKL
ncbi:pectate lyase [Celerinatantimonas sp. YJH-8]|uniref:pectate lyase n=1 Tax=Celerinatantimonas sp. YJH-8 TaxID=3228714 RepID=UPI0038C80A5B